MQVSSNLIVMYLRGWSNANGESKETLYHWFFNWWIQGKPMRKMLHSYEFDVGVILALILFYYVIELQEVDKCSNHCYWCTWANSNLQSKCNGMSLALLPTALTVENLTYTSCMLTWFDKILNFTETLETNYLAKYKVWFNTLTKWMTLNWLEHDHNVCPHNLLVLW